MDTKKTVKDAIKAEYQKRLGNDQTDQNTPSDSQKESNPENEDGKD